MQPCAKVARDEPAQNPQDQIRMSQGWEKWNSKATPRKTSDSSIARMGK